MNKTSLNTSRLFLIQTALVFAFLFGFLSKPAMGQTEGDDQKKNSTNNVFSNPEAFFAVADLTSAVAKKARKSIVTVESFGGVTTQEGVIGGIRRKGEGNTTGIILSSDGLILTSLFNFDGSPSLITVVTSEGRRYVAQPLGRDMTRNLWLLKIQGAKDLPTLPIAPLNEITVGQYAITMGVGYGDSNPAISLGIVSAKNRVSGKAIQTDANTSPANYGGPLLDIQGRLLGICVPLSPRAVSRTAGVEWYDSGIGFAIPLSNRKRWLEVLKKGEHIFPGVIGVTVGPVDNKGGLPVEKIVKKSAAEEAGLKKGDILLRFGGKKLMEQNDLRLMVGRYGSGEKIKVSYRRKDKEHEATITLKRHPSSMPKSIIPGLPPLEELR